MLAAGQHLSDHESGRFSGVRPLWSPACFLVSAIALEQILALSFSSFLAGKLLVLLQMRRAHAPVHPPHSRRASASLAEPRSMGNGVHGVSLLQLSAGIHHGAHQLGDFLLYPRRFRIFGFVLWNMQDWRVIRNVCIP